MMRVFLEDCGRYKRGQVRDWPKGTWQGIHRDWEQVTRSVEEAVSQTMSEDELAEVTETEQPARVRRQYRRRSYSGMA